jgi:hypothetical protein
MTIVNRGTISSTGPNSNSIQGTLKNEVHITNIGTLVGTVQLGGLNDIFTADGGIPAGSTWAMRCALILPVGAHAYLSARLRPNRRKGALSRGVLLRGSAAASTRISLVPLPEICHFLDE